MDYVCRSCCSPGGAGGCFTQLRLLLHPTSTVICSTEILFLDFAAGLASSGSSRVTNAKRLPRRRVADGPKGEEVTRSKRVWPPPPPHPPAFTAPGFQDAARQEQRTGLIGQRSSSARVRAVCRLCLKPVHLIQRRLGGGKIYHRSCFR